MPARLEHYLYGDWRVRQQEWDRKLDKFVPLGTQEVARDKTPWIPAVRLGMASCAALGDLESARMVARYMVGPRLRDIGYTCGPENTPEAVDVYEACADLLLNRPLRLRAGWPGKAKHSARARAIRPVLLSLAAGDAAAASEALDGYVAYYDRRERDRCSDVYLISPDATVMDYLVRCAGGPGKDRPHVLRLA